jgi:hypothetical protein
MRDLLDNAIPSGNMGRVTLRGIGMVAVPLVNGVVGVVQRGSSAPAKDDLRPSHRRVRHCSDVARVLTTTAWRVDIASTAMWWVPSLR